MVSDASERFLVGLISWNTGLTGGYETERRVEFIIPPLARKAGMAHYYIESSCNAMFGQNGMDPPDQNKYYRLNSADLVVPNMDAWRLMWDFDCLRQLVDNLPDDCHLHMKAQWVANEIMNVFQTGSLESVRKAREVAEMVLGEDWEVAGKKESEEAGKQRGTLWGIGHW
jgi:alpha-mannosidase